MYTGLFFNLTQGSVGTGGGRRGPHPCSGVGRVRKLWERKKPAECFCFCLFLALVDRLPGGACRSRGPGRRPRAALRARVATSTLV